MHEPHKHDAPMISQTAALLITICFAVAYVAPFYLSTNLRISDHVSRNSADSIRARSRAVFITSILCFAFTVVVQSLVGGVSPNESFRCMGLFPVSSTDLVKSMLLICILFAGPLFEQGFVAGDWRSWLRWRTIRAEVYDDWIGWRNFVVGPVSEEFIFRSLSISLFLNALTPGPKIVVRAPLLFGVAHLHHLNEFIISHKRRDQSYLSALATPRIIIPGLVRTLFQLGFTSVFGMLVTFIFLRTGNVYSCILAHIFCNWMGLPRVWGRLGESVAADALSSEDHTHSRQVPIVTPAARTYSHGTQWTIAYYVLLFSGAVGFWKLLYPLTESSHRLTDI